MKDLGPNSPTKTGHQATQIGQKPAAQQSQTNGGTFSSLFGFAKNTLNKTLNLG
jgi:hypothetical protein